MSKATLTYLSTTKAHVTGGASFSRFGLSQFLSFQPEGYRFMPAYRYHRWDGFIRLLQPDNTFFAGLGPEVKKYLEEEQGLVVDVDDQRTAPEDLIERDPSAIKLGGGIELYDHQNALVRSALKHKRGVLKASTGGGKTEVMAAIIKCLEAKTRPPKTLVVVSSRNLLKQTAERFEERLGHSVGLIGHGEWNEEWVTVAIPNSLNLPKFKENLKHLLANTELLLIDECHHSSALTYYSVLSRCKAYYRFGVSGTPLDRTDGSGQRLIGITGPVIAEVTTEELVAKGKLARPIVEFIDVKKPRLPDNILYAEAYRLGVVLNKHLHSLVADKAEELANNDKSTLILITQIQQGEFISDELKARGVKHKFVHGSTPDDKLEKALKDFKSGKLKVLVGSAIFGEGTDIPNVDALIVSDGGKSVIRTVQKAGRAMRPKTGKGKTNECRIYDFTLHVHPKLYEHSQARKATYKREKFTFVTPR